MNQLVHPRESSSRYALARFGVTALERFVRPHSVQCVSAIQAHEWGGDEGP
jgi:hypothetical protein